MFVSIPQAVSTIAISKGFNTIAVESFNTASGKYYCNELANWLEENYNAIMFQYRKR